MDKLRLKITKQALEKTLLEKSCVLGEDSKEFLDWKEKYLAVLEDLNNFWNL